jgi:hypothetical protein
MREPDPNVPVDLRDEIEGSADALRPAVEPLDSLADVDEDHNRSGTYTTELPTGARRPYAARQPNPPQVTTDPTLSRAVDAQAAGVDPVALGFDADVHGEAGRPGPIEPTAADLSPDAEDEPAGKYGSSGSPTS